MSKKYYFTDITKAQYMAKHFGWKFNFYLGGKQYSVSLGGEDLLMCDQVGDIAIGNSCSPFYVKPKHHKDLEARVGDFFLVYKKSLEQPKQFIKKQIVIISCLETMLNVEAKKMWVEENEGEIIRRDDKAFFMPKRERKDDRNNKL